MRVTSVCFGNGALLHVEQGEKESRLRHSKMDSWGFFFFNGCFHCRFFFFLALRYFKILYITC